MFAVLEIQTSSEGNMAVLCSTHDSMNAALSKFYQTMISATQSSVYQHTVAIMDNVGQIVKKETVFHEVNGNE